MVCKAQLSYWEDIQVQGSDLPKILIKITQGFLQHLTPQKPRREFQKPEHNPLALNTCHREHYLLSQQPGGSCKAQGSTEPSFAGLWEGAGNGLPGFSQLCKAQSSG